MWGGGKGEGLPKGAGGGSPGDERGRGRGRWGVPCVAGRGWSLFLAARPLALLTSSLFCSALARAAAAAAAAAASNASFLLRASAASPSTLAPRAPLLRKQ
jgi:hypothetical protein